MIKRLLLLAFCSVFLSSTIVSSSFAASEADLRAVYGNFLFYDANDGCGVGPGQFSTLQPGSVVMIGDSITVRAEDDLNGDFPAAWPLTINAEVGRPTLGAADVVRTLDSEISSSVAVVVALGANDLGESDIAAEIKKVYDTIKASSSSTRIFWVNVGSNADGDVGDANVDVGNLNADTPARYSEVNRAINEQSALGYTVIDWFTEVFPDGDPENIDPALVDQKGYLSNDELHPIDEGLGAFSSLIFDKVSGGGIVTSLAQGIDFLPSSIPEPYRTIFSEAAAAYNTDVAALAAVYLNESIRNFGDPPPPYGGGDPWKTRNEPQLSNAFNWPGEGNFRGSKGPFQFLYPTWIENGKDGNNDGEIDVNDLTDAAHGAASFLSSLGAVKGAPIGNPDPDNPYSAEANTIVEAWIGYNAGPGKVRSKGTLVEFTRKYIVNAFENYVEITSGISLVSANGACTSDSGGLGVAPSGFVFPLITTKDSLADGTCNESGCLSWCPTRTESCHGTYPAADIFDETGVPIVAVKPGNVVGTGSSNTYGISVTVKGNDGFVYYYTHMQSKDVDKGDSVRAGDKLGEVGTNADAAGTARHLHFDIAPPRHNSRPSCRRATPAKCAAAGFVDPQPSLVEAYNELPQGGGGGAPDGAN